LNATDSNNKSDMTNAMIDNPITKFFTGIWISIKSWFEHIWDDIWDVLVWIFIAMVVVVVLNIASQIMMHFVSLPHLEDLVAEAEASNEPARTGGNEPEQTGGSEPARTGGNEPEQTGGSEPEQTGT